MKKKVISIVSIVLVCVFLFSGCGGSATTGVQEEKEEVQAYAGKEGRITAYISGPDQMLKDIEEGFEETHGDVLDVLAMGCGPLAQKVNAEAEAGNVQADVIWGAEPIVYIEFQSKGILQQYVSPEAEALKKEYVVGDGFYTLCNARYGVIVYNRERVADSEVPVSWQQLAGENWKNRLAIADAGQSAMALALVAGLVQMEERGWSYLQALKDNGVMLTQQNNQAIEKVASGEVDAAIAPHDGVLRLIKKDKKAGIESKLAIAWPKEGALSVQRPIAIVANKSRPEINNELCHEFVDFVISPAGQKIAAKYGFISVRNDQSLPDGVPKDVKGVSIDWNNAVKEAGELRNEFDRIMTSK